jgi:hypothetical protein
VEPEQFVREAVYQRRLDGAGWERLIKIMVIPSLVIIPALILLRPHVPGFVHGLGMTGMGARLVSYLLLYGGAFVVLLLIGRVVYGHLRSTRELHLRPVVFSPHVLEQDGVAVQGQVRELERTIPAHLTDDRCVVASLVFRQQLETPYYLRSLRSTDFVLELDGGERVLATGQVWLEAPVPVARRIHGDNERLTAALGLVCPTNIPASAKEYQLHPGHRVEISGALEPCDDPRLGGPCQVLRGRPGRPLVIRPSLPELTADQNSRGER